MKKDFVRRIDSTRLRGNGQGAIVAPRASGSGNADTLDGYDAAVLPKPSHIPVSGPDGKLDRGWLPDGAGSVLAAPVSMGGQLFVAPWVLLARALHVSDSVLYVADGRVLTAGDVIVLSRAGYGQEEMTILDDGQALGDAYAYGVGRSEDRIEFPAGTFAANLGNPADGGGYVTIVSGEQAGGVTKGAHINVWSWQADGTRVRRARHGYLQGLSSSEKAFFPAVDDWNIWGSYTDEGFFRGTVHAIAGDFAGNLKVSGTVSVPSGKGRAGAVLGLSEGGHGFVLQNAEGRPVFAAVAPYEEDGQVLSDVAVYIDNKGQKGLFYHLDPETDEYRLEIGVETLIDGRLTAPNILAGLGMYPNAFTGMRLGSEGLQSFGTDFLEQIALDIQNGYFYFGGREGWLYEKGIAIDTRGLVQGLDELEHTIHWIHQTNRTADGGFIGASLGSMAGQLFATVRRYLTDLDTGDVSAQAIDTFYEAQLWLEPGLQKTSYLQSQNVEIRGDLTAALSAGSLNAARAVLTPDGRFATDRLTVGGTALHVTDDKQSVLIGTTSATGARLIVMEDARPAFQAMRSDNQSFAVTVDKNLRTYLSASGALALAGGVIDNTGMGLVMPFGLMRLGSQAAPWQDVYGVRGHFSSLGSQTTLAGKFFLTQRHMTLMVPLDVEDGVAYAREGDLPVGDFLRYEDTDTGGWEIIRVNTTGILTGDGWYEYELDRAAAGTAQRWEMGATGASLGGNDTDGFIWWYGTDDRNPGTGPALVVQQRDNDDHPDSISERAIFGNMAGWYDYEAGYPVYGVAFGRPVGRWVSLDEEQGFRVMFGGEQRAVYREYTQIGTDAGNNVYISDSSLALRVGSTAFIEMDNAGDMDLTGTLAVATGGAITWAGGKGQLFDEGLSYVHGGTRFTIFSEDEGTALVAVVNTENIYGISVTSSGTYGGAAIRGESTSATEKGIIAQATAPATTALQISGGIVDGGSQRYTAMGDATAATDGLNRQTGDARYAPIAGAHAAVTLNTAADTVLGLSTQQITLDTQTANYVWAGPTSGGAATPTFRALVAADIPAGWLLATGATTGATSQAQTFDYGLIVNEGGNDSDTRFEGDTDANLLYLDAGNNRVGIGTASPSSPLHVYQANASIPKTTMLYQSVADTGGSGRVDYFSFQLGATNARGGSIIFGESGGGFGESGIDWNLNLTKIYQYGAYPIVLYTNSSERVRIDGSGYVGINTNAPGTYLDVNADKIRVRTAKTPASASAAGNAGDICWDASYIYICTATNTWQRAAHATW